MCTDEVCSGESSSPSTSDTRLDFSSSYTIDRDLDARLTHESVTSNETSIKSSGFQTVVPTKATGKYLEELPINYTNNNEANINSRESSFSESLHPSHENEVTAVVINPLDKKRTPSSFHHDEINSNISQLLSQYVSTDGSIQGSVDIERSLGSYISAVTSASKRQCISSMKSLPLSPKDTEEFDEMNSLKALQDSMSVREYMIQSSLSSDLQNVDTAPFVKEELKEKIKLRRKKRGLPQLKVQQPSPKLDILTAEEIEKRRVRRERNRIAAAKCRRKKRDAAKEHDKVKQHMQEQNLALLDELYELLNEKGKLQAMLKNHLQECTNTNLPPVGIIQSPGVSINTSLDLNFAILSGSGDEETEFTNESSESSDSESIDLTNDIQEEIMGSSIIVQDEINASHIDRLSDVILTSLDEIDFTSLEFL